MFVYPVFYQFRYLVWFNITEVWFVIKCLFSRELFNVIMSWRITVLIRVIDVGKICL